jgi:hypothetical protein
MGFGMKSFAGRVIRSIRTRRARYSLYSRLPPELRACQTYGELISRHALRDEWYAFFDYYYFHSLSPVLKNHKHYYEQALRGYGEKAFHSLWFLLFDHFRPKQVLEIGVYRGQTVTLWSLLSREIGFPCKVHALSPFADAGDSVSSYAAIDYVSDINEHCQEFNIDMPALCKSYSTADEAAQYISSHRWDLIYIDGNHDYDVASHDWTLCSKNLSAGGIIVMDDSAVGTDFHPPCFATAGHPGPSRVVSEFAGRDFIELPGAGHNRVFQKKRNS